MRYTSRAQCLACDCQSSWHSRSVAVVLVVSLGFVAWDLQPMACGADDRGGLTGDTAPPSSLETLHSKAEIARDRGDFEAVEILRLERLEAIDSLPSSSAWKQGLDAIKLADGAIQRMQYKEAVDILLKAWKPFDATHEATNKAILFGDIAMKIFEAMQAATAVYKPGQADFPTLEDEDLKKIVKTACESDPCQVELRAARAFLTQPAADETFLPQARRKSITDRNEDLLAIAYPEGKNLPIRPWHGPAQFLLGKNSSYVMEDLKFLRYLDPQTQVRGKDRVGEAFHLVYGGSILCYGVSKGKVRFYVDDYQDNAWHRLRPYFLKVDPSPPDKSQKKTAASWELPSTEVQKYVRQFVGQLELAEKELNQETVQKGADVDQFPDIVTDANVLVVMQPIVNRFRGKQRQEVAQATTMILSGNWQKPASDGTPPPAAGASLHDRLVFLAKGFRGYGQAYPAVADIAREAADDVEEIVKSLRKADAATPPVEFGMDGRPPKAEFPPGDDISAQLTPLEVFERMRRLSQLREDWQKRLSAVRVAGKGSDITDDVDSLISDYELMIGCRALEQCLYLRMQSNNEPPMTPDGGRGEDFTKLFGKAYRVALPVTSPPEQVAADAPELTATLKLLESTDFLASLRRDIQESPVSPTESRFQLTELVRKDAVATLDDIQKVFQERARQLRSRDLEDITVDLPLYGRWSTSKAQWSLYEIPHTESPTTVAKAFDNPLVPTLGLSEESLKKLCKTDAEQSIEPEKISIDLAKKITLLRGTPLVQYRTEDKTLTPSLRLGIASEQLPLIAVVLVEHADDHGDGGGAFDDERGMWADTPEPHRLVHDGDSFKSKFVGCDGYAAAGFGKHSREIRDRRGNTLTMRPPGEKTPFKVVSQTGQDISDGGDNVVYSWEAWQDLDQNIVNDFLPSTELFSPSLPVWMTYRKELLRPSPRQSFQWGPARASYYRPSSELLDKLRQQLGW